MSERIEPAGAVADLLAAIVEALDVPLPSIDAADERAYHRLLERRTSDVRIALEVKLHYLGNDVRDTTDAIRRRTAAAPITYTPFDVEESGGAS
ncbi:hypothetical protein [Streptomyces sp. NPDC058572]|uniref:hypothetical protein n=1 Tax=Streptomyces sp. NPDC058572 TaxID=3346546 RepID=UPI003667978D